MPLAKASRSPQPGCRDDLTRSVTMWRGLSDAKDRAALRRACDGRRGRRSRRVPASPSTVEFCALLDAR
jgi:hypothetical protein